MPKNNQYSKGKIMEIYTLYDNEYDTTIKDYYSYSHFKHLLKKHYICDCAYLCEKCKKNTVQHYGEVCEKCLQNRIKCSHCQEKYYDNSMIIRNHKKYCINCYNSLFFKCRNCHEIYHNRFKKVVGENGISYCKKCFEQLFFLCKDCKNIRQICLQNSIVNGYCTFCRPNSYILNYSYKPLKYNFQTTRKSDNLFMGVELEITGAQSTRDLNSIVQEFTNYKDFYFKNDASIQGNGFEIVSHPYTLQYHQNKALWKELFQSLNKLEINKNNGCGLHVHFPKNSLTTDHISALDCFVNINYNLMVKYGGRCFNDYCQNIFKKPDEWGKNNTSRYYAVNLTNPQTVELRFCQSTGDYNVFMHRLQFVHSIVKFICKYNIKAQDIFDYRKKTEDKYINFAQKYYDFVI